MTRPAAPPARMAHVLRATRPARGSRQCLTLITESPSIAAISTARAGAAASERTGSGAVDMADLRRGARARDGGDRALRVLAQTARRRDRLATYLAIEQSDTRAG